MATLMMRHGRQRDFNVKVKTLTNFRTGFWTVAGTILAVCAGSAWANPVLTTDPAGGGQSHENHQPALGINYLVATEGVYPDRDPNSLFPSFGEPFLGEITMFAGNFAPRGWMFANGQTLPISQFTALFSVFGTTYGGDGRQTFGLPDLRGRSAMHFGNGPGLTPRPIGSKTGVEQVTLSVAELPPHMHPMAPPIGATDSTGGGQAHENMAPAQAINYFVRPDTSHVHMAGFSFAPNGSASANGQLLSVVQNEDWFDALGTTFGGDGTTTFALPDLRGRVVMHEGQGPGLTQRNLGAKVGAETVALNVSELPIHDHPADDPVGNAGQGLDHENMQPTNTLNYIIAREGLFPSRSLTSIDPLEATFSDPFLGEIRIIAGDVAPDGWSFADGEVLSIAQNQALFSILGTMYGGDGETTFRLPDLRGRLPVHVGGFRDNGPGLREWQLGESHGVETVFLTEAEIASHTHNYVPEPSSAALLAMAVSCALGWRRGRRR